MDIWDTIELGLHREVESRQRLLGSDEFKSDDCKEEKITNRQALWTLIWNSLPAWGALLVRRAVELINYMVVGRMDDPDYISGVGLGIITSSIVWFSIGIGLAGGIETLSSQAFGNKSYYLAGWYYNRAQVILTVLFILQGVVLYYSADILIFIGEPVNASEYAGIYIRTNLPGIWAYCQTELLRRFLWSQGEFNLVLKIQIVTTVLHPLWVYIFVGPLNLDIVGIAVATCITYILNFVIGTVYITLNKSVVKEGSWHWINRDSFKGIIEYLRYGIPSMIHECEKNVTSCKKMTPLELNKFIVFLFE